MGNIPADSSHRIRAVANEQLFAVLATRGAEDVHTSIVAFAINDTLDAIVFATPRASRKFANILHRERVSLLLDNRKNDAARLGEITGISASGKARRVEGAEREPLAALYTRKHPYMKAFVEQPGTALVRVAVERYDVVTSFQNVTTLRI